MGAACSSDRDEGSGDDEDLQGLIEAIKDNDIRRARTTARSIARKTRGLRVPTTFNHLLTQAGVTRLAPDLKANDIETLRQVKLMRREEWEHLLSNSSKPALVRKLRAYVQRVNCFRSLDMALIRATKDERNAIVSMLLKNGASLEYGDEHEKTALMWASMQGSVETAKILLEAKANPDACDSSGRTALSLAIDLNQLGIKNLLNPPPPPQVAEGDDESKQGVPPKAKKRSTSNDNADTNGVTMMGGKDDIKHKGKNYSNGSHEIKEEDDDDDDDIMKNLNKELRADGGEVNAYEEERKQMKLKRKQLKKKKKKKKRKEDLQKEKAPIDVPALLTKAGSDNNNNQ
eukprot:jgi/Bigna1/67607/fgenesh1_pg.4_\